MKKFFEFVKKYRFDIIGLIVLLVLAFTFSEKPNTKVEVPKHKKASSSPTTEKQELEKTEKKDKEKDKYAKIKERNIFSASGTYETVAELKIPENPYTLMAVLKEGDEKRVILKEFTGNIVVAKKGTKLIDGSTVKKIGDSYVEIKKGKETRKLAIFEVKRR